MEDGRRSPCRRHLAHARFGQELIDALLWRLHHRRAGDGESDAGFPDRSKRPGRSTLRPVPALPRNPAANSGAGRTLSSICASCSMSRAVGSCSPPSRSSRVGWASRPPVRASRPNELPHGRERPRRKMRRSAGRMPTLPENRDDADDGKALSLRRNIEVIADEAHRSQYDLIDGLASNLRDALPFATLHRLHRHADRAD